MENKQTKIKSFINSLTRTDSAARGFLYHASKIRTDSAVRGFLHTPFEIRCCIFNQIILLETSLYRLFFELELSEDFRLPDDLRLFGRFWVGWDRTSVELVS